MEIAQKDTIQPNEGNDFVHAADTMKQRTTTMSSQTPDDSTSASGSHFYREIIFAPAMRFIRSNRCSYFGQYIFIYYFDLFRCVKVPNKTNNKIKFDAR